VAVPVTELRALIRDIPDFPTPGILFKDITPLLADGAAWRAAIDGMADGRRVDAIVGIEARGFLVGAAVAYQLGVGFVPLRKPGKLPYTTANVTYDLEYGTDGLEMHSDALARGHRALIVDDVLATGGTAAAAAALVEGAGATVAGLAFLIELSFLSGRARLTGRDVEALITY
jgi:adenine phosphoribosyltransferase